MKTIKICSIILLFSISYIKSQVTLEWVNRYHGTKSGAEARSFTTDQYGNIYVTGYCVNLNTNIDIVTIKYNSNGQSLWTATYSNGSEWEGGQAIVQDKYGNVYVTGDGKGANGFVTVKYNSSGVQQWVKSYSPNKMASPVGICLDSSGNVYVAGYTSTPYYNFDIVTIKYNETGEEKWINTFTQYEDSTDYPCSISYNVSGGIYIGGFEQSANNNVCFLVINYDTLGVRKWYSLSTWGIPKVMVTDNSGNVYLAGSDGAGSYVTEKLYATGQWWYKKYQRTGGYCSANSLAVDKQGNVFVTGVIQGPGNDDIGTIKYSPSGVQQWVTIYNGPANANDAGNNITLDTNGNIYVTGFVTGTGTSYDFGTIKYSQNGQQIWSHLYNGPFNGIDESFKIITDKYNNVFVCGRSTGLDSAYEFTTVKYSQIIGIVNISPEVPSKFTLFQNYPNPFNPNTKIKFSLPPTSPAVSGINSGGMQDAKLVIYDVMGKEIAVFTPPLWGGGEGLGTYEVEWNASNYPSGVYFYKLIAENFSVTKKMVLLK